MFSRVVVTRIVRLAVIILALVGAGVGQDLVTVQVTGKQPWPAHEVDKLYLAACQAVQRQFGVARSVRPQITLILGAEKNEAVMVKNEVRLVKWDPYLFAQGVVILAFEDFMTTDERLLAARRAVNLADTTVEVRTGQR